MIKIIRDKDGWNRLLKTVGRYDFYHTYDYHHMDITSNDDPLIVKYQEADKIIAIPLIFRTIEGTPYKDATSVYGYPGPIFCNIDTDFDNRNFSDALQTLFEENNIVSVFSRLNPYLKKQDIVLDHVGEISKLGKVVNIDLTKDLEIQKENYNPRLRTYVNKCRKNYLIRIASSETELGQFINIYYENMRRVNAKNRYFFNHSYFIELWKSSDFKTDVLLALEDKTNEIIGGAVFIKKNNIVQYHLSGVKKEYLKLNPIKVLIDEMRIIATHEGYKYFNLGGGVGNNDDSLFKFKSGYSKDYWSFKIWKYIVNPQVYDQLIQLRGNKGCGKFSNRCSLFFPCYRCSYKNF